jgi:hypothetical protein
LPPVHALIRLLRSLGRFGCLGMSALSVCIPMNGQMNGIPGGLAAPLSSSSSSTTVRGTVLNGASGLPVPRALVRLSERAVLTDHEGKFEFDEFVSSGSAMLQVTKPGFYSSPEAEANISIGVGRDQMAAPIVVRLYPEALLTGTLTAADGTPLPQIMVTAQRSVYNESGHQWMQVATSTTNSRGEFRLAVPPGDYRIETQFSPRLSGTSRSVLPMIVPASNSSTTSSSIHMVSGSEERFDLHPVVGAAYSVTVHLDPPAERGFPAILARSSDGTVLPVGMARAPDGNMRLELPSGTFTLIANLNMGQVFEYGETTITIADHSVAGVVLRLAQVPPISVELIQDGASTSDKPQSAPAQSSLQQLGLTLESSEDMPLRRGSFFAGPVSAGGGASAFRVPPGTYHFVARNSGQWFVKSATYGTADLLQQDLTITSSAGSTPVIVTVSNRTGSLGGVATLKGNPASVWVYLVPMGPSATPVYIMRSGTDGSINFPNLPPGNYQAIAFEGRHSANYRDPKLFADYATYVRSVNVNTGEKATLSLDAVPSMELVP